MLEDALALTAQGWAVFPCESKGKRPLTRHGFKDATLDRELVREMSRRWPRANIGGASGAPSGRITLDVDPRNGGDESLAELLALHGPLPDTQERLTGGGGRHIDFGYPGFRVPCSSGLVGPGLDVKGDGGYVLLPRSVHPSGRRYEWEASGHPDDVPLAEMPSWLLRLVTGGRAAPEAQGDPTGSLSQVRLPLGRAARAFIARGAPIGEQRIRAVAAARNLLSSGHGVAETADAVWRGLRASTWDPDREPWTRADALAIARDLASKPAPPPKPLFHLARPAPAEGGSPGLLVGQSAVRLGLDARACRSDTMTPFPKSRDPRHIKTITTITIKVGSK